MKTWELIKICGDGGYIEGDQFANQTGEQVLFDGHTIKGIDEINPHDEWMYVEK